jgi:hypothetical protein
MKTTLIASFVSVSLFRPTRVTPNTRTGCSAGDAWINDRIMPRV